MWFVVWSSIAIFTLVATVLIYSAWKFRAPPGDESDGPPIHGNTKLEIVWTIVPTVLLAVMAVWAYLVLSDNEALANDRLIVNVDRRAVRVELPVPRRRHRDAATCGCPVDRQVELRMRSEDVIHDFYVVQFRVKEDVVPGHHDEARLQPDARRHLPGHLRRALRRRARRHAQPGDRDGAGRVRRVARQVQGGGRGPAGAAQPSDASGGTEPDDETVTAADPTEAPAAGSDDSAARPRPARKAGTSMATHAPTHGHPHSHEHHVDPRPLSYWWKRAALWSVGSVLFSFGLVWLLRNIFQNTPAWDEQVYVMAARRASAPSASSSASAASTGGGAG